MNRRIDPDAEIAERKRRAREFARSIPADADDRQQAEILQRAIQRGDTALVNSFSLEERKRLMGLVGTRQDDLGLDVPEPTKKYEYPG